MERGIFGLIRKQQELMEIELNQGRDLHYSGGVAQLKKIIIKITEHKLTIFAWILLEAFKNFEPRDLWGSSI